MTEPMYDNEDVENGLLHDQRRKAAPPVPQEAAPATGTVATFMDMDMRLDTTMPVGQVDVQDSKGRRTIIPATAPDLAMREREIARAKLAYGKLFNENCANLGEIDELRRNAVTLAARVRGLQAAEQRLQEAQARTSEQVTISLPAALGLAESQKIQAVRVMMDALSAKLQEFGLTGAKQ